MPARSASSYKIGEVMYESRLGTARISRSSDGAAISLPRMWYVFVVSCLPFSLVVATQLIRNYPGSPLFLIGLTGLVALVSLYFWMTLRDSLSAQDVSPTGIPRATLRRRLMLISAMVLINHLMFPLFPDFRLWWLFIYPMVAAGLALPLIQAKTMVIGLTGLSMAHAWYFQGVFQPILLSLAVLALGAIIIRVLTITNIELERSRDDTARLAVAEERLRFARDLHDSLGHSLSTIVLKSELGGRVIEQDPERAGNEIRDVEQVARDALHEVRSVVIGYRQPTLSGEIEAARAALSAAGINCTVANDAGQLPSAIESVLAWGVREGVTNIIRHSGARNCTIRIIRENGTARLELVDDGRTSPGQPMLHKAGTGLTGLSERVAHAGGGLTAGARHDGGFQLVLEAPASIEGMA